ncbi:23S rRNA pseudouridine(2604) synthase RluF [Chitinophaga sp. 2R12]|uniref:Pseudouridine synthase n=2 Tax=Chitinophagaceae TaxID=563835 RepID=A0ABS5J736_9BACT|nr:23S rRNA pseudouridine(2604) synthase RluF [Chitinophaga hostae]
MKLPCRSRTFRCLTFCPVLSNLRLISTVTMDISVNKYISETGFCSRREADKYIEQGRVTINDNIASKGNRVKDGDVVEVDGEPLKKKKSTVYIALNKPKGITCTTDLKDKTNIIDYVNFSSRIFPIGRLDKRSEGLIFLTNDGDIVNKILRAGNQHEKEYIVTVDKPIDLEFVKAMRSGVRILGVMTQKCFVQQEGANRFRIILTEGLNRQIRRMCEALGYEVVTLKRTRIMNMTLKDLAPGSWRYFTKEEINNINALVANSSKTEKGDNNYQDGMDE